MKLRLGGVKYWECVLVLWLLFAVVTGVYLGSVPGLLGDEASEGENVREILTNGLTVYGERSYIGPLMDYVRVPFVWLLGYGTWALRLPVLLLSWATFWLMAEVLRRQFGETVALFGLVMLFFSPVYLTYQRLGWAITLFPFFTALLLCLILKHSDNSEELLARHELRKTSLRIIFLIGLVAGLGLSNHVLFLPTLAGVVAGLVAYSVPDWFRDWRKTVALYFSFWPAGVGFLMGFGLQWWVLVNDASDQGNFDVVREQFGERLVDVWSFIPLAVSGSSFFARYIGVEFSGDVIRGLSGAMLILAGLAIVLLRKKVALWAWIVGGLTHFGMLLYVIDRFTLRYFVQWSLWWWLLVGLGLGVFLQRARLKEQMVYVVALLLAVLLSGWWWGGVFNQWRMTGGSTADFSLGNRTNSAAALVDVEPLLTCLEAHSEMTVQTENVHIWNRLQYLSHERPWLTLLPEDSGEEGDVRVHYRWPEGSEKKNDCVLGQEACPELQHFCVVRNKGE